MKAKFSLDSKPANPHRLSLLFLITGKSFVAYNGLLLVRSIFSFSAHFFTCFFQTKEKKGLILIKCLEAAHL